MNLTKTEMIDLIYSCTNVDKSTIEKEIWSTVNMHDNYISFSLNPAYYVLPTDENITVFITFSNQIYSNGKIIQECLIMSPESQEIIDEQYLFYYISIPMLLNKKINNEKVENWELSILEKTSIKNS